MKQWLKRLFETQNKENQLSENKLNGHKHDIVDMSIAKKRDAVKKQVDKQLETRHQFAMVAHEPTCHIFHDTNPLLDCHGQCNYQVKPNVIVSKPYAVYGREPMQEGSINAVKEKDGRINEDIEFPEFDSKN